MTDQTLQLLLSRLDHLTAEFNELREGVRKAVRISDDDPEMALTRARKVLEYVVRDVFVLRCAEEPGTRPLENLLQRLVKDGHMPKRLGAYASYIRDLGNVGTHSYGEDISKEDVRRSFENLTAILEWYFERVRPDAFAKVEDKSRTEDATRADETARRLHEEESRRRVEEAERQRLAAEESKRARQEAEADAARKIAEDSDKAAKLTQHRQFTSEKRKVDVRTEPEKSEEERRKKVAPTVLGQMIGWGLTAVMLGSIALTVIYNSGIFLMAGLLLLGSFILFAFLKEKIRAGK